MAEEVLVKDVFSRDMEDGGAELVRGLDQANIPVDAALWLYIPELNVWLLMLSSPEVSTKGPKSLYHRINRVLSGMTGSKFKLTIEHISVVDPRTPIISALGSFISTGPGISGIRFSRNVINGIYIEDAYIYRLVETAPQVLRPGQPKKKSVKQVSRRKNRSSVTT
jgi:hypothetical protein